MAMVRRRIAGSYYHRDQLPLVKDSVLVEGDNEDRDLDRFGCLLLNTANLAGLVKYPLQHGQFVWLDRIEHMNVLYQHSFIPKHPQRLSVVQKVPDCYRTKRCAPQASVLAPGRLDLVGRGMPVSDGRLPNSSQLGQKAP
jgi:hypothetical protein